MIKSILSTRPTGSLGRTCCGHLATTGLRLVYLTWKLHGAGFDPAADPSRGTAHMQPMCISLNDVKGPRRIPLIRDRMAQPHRG